MLISGVMMHGHVHSVQVYVAVSEHYALGSGAGPAGIEHFRDRVLIELHDVLAVWRGGQHLFIRAGREPLCLRCTVELVKRAHRAQLFLERVDESSEFLLQEKGRRARIIQDVSQLRTCQTNVERKQNAARFQNSKVCLEQAMAVQAEKCDSITGLQPGAPQSTGQAPHPIAKLSIGKTPVLTNYRRLARKLLCRVAKETDRCEGNVHTNLLSPGGLTTIDDEDVSGHIGG